ncbi:protein FAR1-RELATED SEQUENCE 5-like isoform X2 [Nymphaea colorata]|nr:protein FAR1-RELATED SEQUENCE 5-like isoform X2 [Nymphaea colorata]XP_031490361.1 protein FAR1-RELATED SEQUENCE 5-like isoform X2 [Nymphaea colorata]XP_031490362.1 protein FAR1-RELATED SEQUENCE 5-like isoform X2 [Nymphaea colorata]XP_031490363.1 protein FAR1-RELATED SEQUENCE 5-like isoform X2 [Nymphaea colorata]XP_031490366.1 protein FAR1-RELATED SEQUENCE 5-like isoform X2 [Nymphaea colorata]XP_031490367.1 protein FAR1-RELATED SEQUENCE 5-like isoform X2 [Nymphaea colorata]XP_049934794.1 pr
MDPSCSSTSSNVSRKGDMFTSANVREAKANEMMTALNNVDEIVEDTNLQGNEDVEIEKFCVEGTNSKEELVPDVSSEYVPYVGMEFDDEDKAYEFYNTYARMGGFDTCVRDSKRKKGVVCWKQFACKKNGFKKQKGNERKEYPSTKCGCKAWMSIELNLEKKKWRVHNIQYAHNHYLHSSSEMYFHKTAKKMNTSQKNVVEAMIGSGLTASEVMDLLAFQIWDMKHMTFTRQKLDILFQEIADSYHGKDCQTMVNYFKKKKNANRNFYYAIQVDKVGQLGNCFWVDATAREDYHHFGDVVSFDLMYSRNKYDMIFAQFTGVNHHNQNIIFGCALLIDENKETFKWVFEQWLRSMGDRAPITFLTDQDFILESTLKEVLPSTVHKYCNWDIFARMPKYIENLFKQDHHFKRLWDAWFFKSETIEEFEKRWNEMISSYPQLETIEWATILWKERDKWAKPYFNGTLMVGMSMAQRSKSIDNYFKNWVGEDTTLSELIVKYDVTIGRQRYNEKEMDFKMYDKIEPIKTHHPMEAHLRDTFTPEIFKKYFQEELLATTTCTALLNQPVGEVREYTVTQVIQDYRKDGVVPIFKEYTISYDEESQKLSSCRCTLWESLGVVCCHMFTVFNAEQIFKLPPAYILKRWSKHARKGVVQKFSTSQALPDPQSSLLVKRNILHSKANMCIDEALSCDECYEDALDEFDKLLKHMQNVKSKVNVSIMNDREVVQVSVIDDNCCNESAHMEVLQSTNEDENHDVIPRSHELVCAKASSRQIIADIHQTKLQRFCATCGQLGHNSRACSRSMKARNTSTNGEVAKQRICHYCQGTGHDKRNCPKLRDAGIELQRLCSTCGQHGHNSQTCSLGTRARNTSTDGEVAKQRTCHSCKGTGHDKRNCPQLKNAGKYVYACYFFEHCMSFNIAVFFTGCTSTGDTQCT